MSLGDSPQKALRDEEAGLQAFPGFALVEPTPSPEYVFSAQASFPVLDPQKLLPGGPLRTGLTREGGLHALAEPFAFGDCILVVT